MANKNNKMMTAFLVHPRESIKSDLLLNKRFWLLRFVKEEFINNKFKSIPFVVGKVWHNKKHIGWTIAITMTGAQMLAEPKKARERILEAVLYAQNTLKADIVGLGSFTGSKITQGGEWLKKQPSVSIAINNGNDFTAFSLVQSLKNVCVKKNVDLKKESVFIVGATGSIGSAVSKWLAKEEYKVILYSSNFEKTLALANKIKEDYAIVSDKVIASKDDSDMIKAKIIVVVSRSTENLISAKNLQKDAIICDATMPRNVSKDIMIERPDVLVVDIGRMKLDGLRTQYNIGLDKKEIYACMASVFAMAHLGELYDVVGDIQYETAVETAKYLNIKDFPIGFATYKSFGEEILF